jgi:predicted short-subunit dehydrogenase-like oxidoreductase (DUF2520 family)
MIKVIIIGGGNVAFHLTSQFLKAPNVQLVQLYNRSISKIKPFENQVSITSDISKLELVDIYIIATSDDAIPKISSEINFNNQLVVHTSGSVSIESISNNNRRGVFYPLQTLSKSKEINFSEIPLCLEAEYENDLRLLKQLASELSNNIYTISSSQRQYLHVSAVFVNNFVNHLYHIGHHICKEHNIPFSILQPLILETAEKIKLLEPKSAQTGPALRDDLQTIENHLKILNNKNQEIYKILTTSIKDTYERSL